MTTTFTVSIKTGRACRNNKARNANKIFFSKKTVKRGADNSLYMIVNPQDSNGSAALCVNGLAVEVSPHNGNNFYTPISLDVCVLEIKNMRVIAEVNKITLTSSSKDSLNEETHNYIKKTIENFLPRTIKYITKEFQWKKVPNLFEAESYDPDTTYQLVTEFIPGDSDIKFSSFMLDSDDGLRKLCTLRTRGLEQYNVFYGDVVEYDKTIEAHVGDLAVVSHGMNKFYGVYEGVDVDGNYTVRYLNSEKTKIDQRIESTRACKVLTVMRDGNDVTESVRESAEKLITN